MAKNRVKISIRKDPAVQAERWYRRAYESFEKKDYGLCRAQLQKAAALMPDQAEYQEALFNIARRTRNKTHQIEALRELTRIDPGNHYMWNERGLLEKDPAESIRALTIATQLDPFNEIYWYNRGVTCSDYGDHTQAEECLRRATEINPGNADYWACLSFAQGENGDEAGSADSLARAAELNPRDADQWKMLADMYDQLNQPEKSRDAYLNAIAVNPRIALCWFNLGILLHDKLSEPAAAATALREFVKLKPRDHGGWSALADILAAMGKNDEARAAYRKALKFKPDNVYYLREFGNICEASGRHGEAFRAFRRAAGAALDAYPAGTPRPLEKPRVFSATVDLKLNAEGRIKVCEFNDLWNSGFEGFKRITGKDMVADIVEPYYDSLFERWRAEARNIKSLVARDDLYAPDDFLSFFSHARSQPRSTVVANADAGFMALCAYKDYLAAVIPEELKSYAPQTIVLPLSERGAASAQISSSFGHGRRLVIKPSDSFQGNGVEIVTSDDAATRAAEIAAAWRGEKQDGASHWNANIHPNLLVQECVASTPALGLDGLPYDGTMRVAFTAVLMPGETTPQIHFHGSYWKLPPQPCNGAGGHDAIVSFSPSKHIDKLDTIFSDKPFAAPVTDEHYAAARDQLEFFLQKLLPAAAAKPEAFLGKVEAMMDSDQEWIRALGTRLATDHSFGNMLSREAGKKTPEKLLAKMSGNLASHPGDAAQSYLRQIFTPAANPGSVRESHFAFDVAAYMKKNPAANDFRKLVLTA